MKEWMSKWICNGVLTFMGVVQKSNVFQNDGNQLGSILFLDTTLISFFFLWAPTHDIVLTLLVSTMMPLYREDFKCQPSLTPRDLIH